VSGAWSLKASWGCFPTELMFGVNENVIFIITGDYNSVLTLFDDSSGAPVYLWSFEIHVSLPPATHILS
jgi:hypothetical protein